MTTPDPQDPLSPLYEFIDTQPADVHPCSRDSSLSHFTVRQFTPENITNGLPSIVTKTGHGMRNGDAIRATQFITVPFASATGMEQLNNRLFYVQQATADTFILTDANAMPIDTRNFTVYKSGGQFTTTATFLVVNPAHFPPLGIPSILDV